MSWNVELTSGATRALRRIPSRDRQRIDAALLLMKDEPLSGDVVPLKGEYQGTFRRRVGSWRLIFSAKPDIQVVVVHDIRRRTSSTY